MRQNADVLYKLTSQEIGSRVGEAPEEKRNISDGSFTKHLITAGMYRTSGLNCSQDREKLLMVQKIGCLIYKIFRNRRINRR